MDKHDITRLLTAEASNENPLAIKFRTAAERFRLIDNQGVAIVVPFIPLAHWEKDGSPQIVKANELDDFFRQQLDDVGVSELAGCFGQTTLSSAGRQFLSKLTAHRCLSRLKVGSNF